MKKDYKFKKGLPLKPEDVRLTLEGMSEEEIKDYERLVDLIGYEPNSDRLMGSREESRRARQKLVDAINAEPVSDVMIGPQKDRVCG